MTLTIYSDLRAVGVFTNYTRQTDSRQRCAAAAMPIEVRLRSQGEAIGHASCDGSIGWVQQEQIWCQVGKVVATIARRWLLAAKP